MFSKMELIQWHIDIKAYKKWLKNIDNYVNENKTERNEKWPYIPDHPHRIVIIGGSGS